MTNLAAMLVVACMGDSTARSDMWPKYLERAGYEVIHAGKNGQTSFEGVGAAFRRDGIVDKRPDAVALRYGWSEVVQSASNTDAAAEYDRNMRILAGGFMASGARAYVFVPDWNLSAKSCFGVSNRWPTAEILTGLQAKARALTNCGVTVIDCRLEPHEWRDMAHATDDGNKRLAAKLIAEMEGP